MRGLNRFVLLAAIAFLAPSAMAQSPVKKAEVKAGARIAIVGDSITEQKLYSRFIESYLTACYPELNVRVFQFGWGGETAGGFLARMDNDLLPFKPDIVTLCYGMNDGGYAPFNKATGERFEKPLREIVKKAKAAGATVVVGSPGAVDTYFFDKQKSGGKSPKAEMYNGTLAKLRDITMSIAKDNEMPFANVHDTMTVAMVKAQEKLGDKYYVCGADGFHPASNGQLLMALAFLRSLQLDGDLGSVHLDMGSDAKGAGGHKVLSEKDGTIEIESTRFPFAFSGDDKDPNGTRSITAFAPFNEEFNRFMLYVSSAKSDKLSVTWGKESKIFTKAELKTGVNLAAEFANHPLSAAFQKVDAAVADRQNFQTFMIKSVITQHRGILAMTQGDPEIAKALETVRDRLWMNDAKRYDAVRATLKPVKHTIVIAKAE